jgi:acyl carrier protein
VLDQIKSILRDALQLDGRANKFTDATPLLGSIPEFDSMAVLTVLTLIEERFDITIDDDEVSAELFATVGTLREFVEEKVGA